MPEFARPDSDIALGGWTDQGGGAVNIYTTIDEVAFDDADYVRSPSVPANAAYEAGTSNVPDPLSSSGHIVRWRASKDLAGGGQIDITMRLMQGVTQITSQVQTNVSATPTTFTYTLTAAEADAITDYNDLRLKFTANQV